MGAHHLNPVKICLQCFVLKGGGKRGYIVADALLLVMFLGWANELNNCFVFILRKPGNICCGHVTERNQSIFCVSDVSRASKQGNICVRNIVSSFA